MPVEDHNQPSTSQGFRHNEESDSSSDDDYLEIFDPDKFVRDGNDIRFQLPSTSAAFTLSRNLDDVQRRAVSLKRRNTTRVALVRKKSSRSKPPTIEPSSPQPEDLDDDTDRSSKPKIYLQAAGGGGDFDDVDSAADECENLVSGEDRLAELENIRHKKYYHPYPVRTFMSPNDPLSGLTLPMGQKKQYREEIINRAYIQPSGLTLARYAATKKWLKMRKKMNEISHYANIGRGTLKEIEGQFGAGIMEYFKLVKWMIVLNFILCLPMMFIIIPHFAISPSTFEGRFINAAQQTPVPVVMTSIPSISTTFKPTDTLASRREQLSKLHYGHDLSRNCSVRYENLYNPERKFYEYILDFVQGTGWFEYTPLFYGYYFNKTLGIGGAEETHHWYNTSVAYLIATMFFFMISLIFIVVSTSSGLEDNLLSDQLVYYKSINQVFAGWDFGLYNEKSARIKKSLIRLEITKDLAEKRRFEKYHNRTTSRRCFLYFVRVVVNLLVTFVLIGCAAAVYFAQTESEKQLNRSINKKQNQTPIEAFTDLVWQYFPSVLITVMYAFFPNIFRKLAKLERYYPATEQNVTIARIVLLRLGTVFLLLVPIFGRVISCDNREYCGNCKDLHCWETFIGQQVYKLVLLDFFVIVGVVFFVEFPRKKLWKKYNETNGLIRFIGQEEFDIPVNVMDMVYTQTLCWIGTFYSPLLPFISFFKVLIFFLVRKLSLFHNQKPAAVPYRASSMNLFFQCVLTLAFFIAVLAVGLSVGVITPSRSCGPFRTHTSINDLDGSGTDKYTMFGAIAESLLLLPQFPRDIISFLGSAPFIAALIVVLLLLIYLYAARSTGQLRLVELLRETLKREEKDKHWLLDKVNSSLKRELSAKS